MVSIVAMMLLSCTAIAEQISVVPERRPVFDTDQQSKLLLVGTDLGPLLYVAPEVRQGQVEVFSSSSQLLLAAIVAEDPRMMTRKELQAKILDVLNRPESTASRVVTCCVTRTPLRLALPKAERPSAYLMCVSVAEEDLASPIDRETLPNGTKLAELLRRSVNRDTFDVAGTLAINLKTAQVYEP